MSRLSIVTDSKAQTTIESLYKDMERRISASQSGLCNVDLTAAFVRMCHTQSCGKCTPCRVGLGQIIIMLEDILDNRANMQTLDILRNTAQSIAVSADCAIGSEAAKMVLRGLDGFYDDYLSHIENHRCNASFTWSIPCVQNCPANVDIPGYIALVADGRYADAVRLIRKDNPFVSACALICEHPCETRCRRTILDAPINIRGLKRAAVDGAGNVSAPSCAASTGKKVAVIGGGPSGLSCAYYLQLMGHQVTVFEQHKHLGGMLRYGIPAYRLPRTWLGRDIDTVLSTGVEVKLDCRVGNGDGELSIDKIRSDYDAIYLSIGAHQDKKIGIQGEDADGVISAVELLGNIGDGIYPDFTGKKVAIVGGGNVAMDCTRTALRSGASKVMTVYRRRVADMTALPEEIEGAVAEGAEMIELHSPLFIKVDDANKVTGLCTSPKQIGLIKDGRPSPTDSGKEDEVIPCDIVIVAIGQGINTSSLEDSDIPITKGVIDAKEWTAIENSPGIFAGGDCVTGPKTAIRAIAAGKVAAANIDNYLGYNHKITVDVDIPKPSYADRPYCGRVFNSERPADERVHDFELMEQSMTEKESHQEASRCLRCDHFGCGIFKGGRQISW